MTRHPLRESTVSDSSMPVPTELTAPFWQAARDGRLVAQQCCDCELLRHYPQVRCPQCHSPHHTWTALSGHGEIYSFSVTHKAFNPAWADRVPYVVATIELAEGIRMVSDLDESPELVAIGQPVEVFFDRVTEDVTLPRFRVVSTSSDSIAAANDGTSRGTPTTRLSK